MLDMAELAYEAGGAARRTAMVLDVRSRAFSTDLAGAVRALRERGFSPRVVFVDADDEVLIRRFESVRRSHPLQGDGRLADGIAAERELLAEAREQADVIIDTSHLNVNQLRAPGRGAVRRRGRPPAAGHRAVVRLQVRPAARRRLRGRRAVPAQPVLGAGAARPHRARGRRSAGTCWASAARCTFVETYARLINATAPGFEREGKRYLTVAVGCTGGKHRSVAIAEELPAACARCGIVGRTPSTATWGASEARGSVGASAAGTGSPPRCGRCARCARPGPRHHRGGHGRRRRRVQRPAAGRAGGAAAGRPAAGAGRPRRPDRPGHAAAPPSCSRPVRAGRPERARSRPPGRQPGAVRPDGAARRPGGRAGSRAARWSAPPAGCCRCRDRPLGIEADVRGGDPARPADVVTVRPARVAVAPGRGARTSGSTPPTRRPARRRSRRSATADWLIFGPGQLVHQRDPAPAGAGPGRRDRGQPGPPAGHAQPRAPRPETAGLSLPDHLRGAAPVTSRTCESM